MDNDGIQRRSLVSHVFRTMLIGGTIAVALSIPPVALAQDAAKGEQVYTAQKCSVCHNIMGKGAKNNPLDGVGKKLSAAEIREWIVNPVEMTKKMNATGKPPMPSRYAKLPAAEIDSLVAYMQSLK
jgi:mono/diheme cytochrome c family protein